MNPATILIVYPPTGQRIALDLVECLESLGRVTLRSYERLPGKMDVSVAVCVVADDYSLDQAHDLQQRFIDIPTLIVDDKAEGTIPVNGFVGLVSPIPNQVFEAVEGILANGSSASRAGGPESSRPRRTLASRFDITLARTAGLSQSLPTILGAATRHLAWELRANVAEAYLLDLSANPIKVFCEPSTVSDSSEVSSKLLRVLERRARPTCLTDLNQIQDRSLFQHMEMRGLTVVVPFLKENKLMGWLGLGLDASTLTDDFLDDLYVVTHLLTLSLISAPSDTVEQINLWDRALGAFRTGMLILDRQGKVTDLAGEMNLLGNSPARGASFTEIRNGRIREIVARALRGNFTSSEWCCPGSAEVVRCSAAAFSEESMVLSFGISKFTSTPAPESAPPSVDLKELLSSLPVPVLPDSACGSPAEIPGGQITAFDSDQIRKCANAALAKEAKSLRFRCRREATNTQAVLFFESPQTESESTFGSDVNEAVRFVVLQT
jgi:hypothetical protein